MKKSYSVSRFGISYRKYAGVASLGEPQSSTTRVQHEISSLYRSSCKQQTRAQKLHVTKERMIYALIWLPHTSKPLVLQLMRRSNPSFNPSELTFQSPLLNEMVLPRYIMRYSISCSSLQYFARLGEAAGEVAAPASGSILNTVSTKTTQTLQSST